MTMMTTMMTNDNNNDAFYSGTTYYDEVSWAHKSILSIIMYPTSTTRSGTDWGVADNNVDSITDNYSSQERHPTTMSELTHHQSHLAREQNEAAESHLEQIETNRRERSSPEKQACFRSGRSITEQLIFSLRGLCQKYHTYNASSNYSTSSLTSGRLLTGIGMTHSGLHNYNV